MKNSGVKSKAGGTAAHLPASPGNNPGTSRSVDTSFGGKAGSDMKTSQKIDARKSRPNCKPEGV